MEAHRHCCIWLVALLPHELQAPSAVPSQLLLVEWYLKPSPVLACQQQMLLLQDGFHV